MTLRANCKVSKTPFIIDDHMRRTMQTFVRDIFYKVDTNKDDKISLSEFKEGFAKNPDICGFFQQIK